MTLYQVTADHISPNYKFLATPVDVRSTRSDRDPQATVFYAQHPKLGCGKTYSTERDAIYGLFQDHACVIVRIEEMRFNHDSHVRAYYDQPARFLVDAGSKFTGERLAVHAAYEKSLNGFYQDQFGSVEDVGYYCRVCFDGPPFIVCFREDSQGFITEVDNAAYEMIWADYITAQEEDEDEDTITPEIEEDALQAKIRKHKENLFAISMELESLAEDAGFPDKHDILEVSANIQEQCDELAKLLGDAEE